MLKPYQDSLELGKIRLKLVKTYYDHWNIVKPGNKLIKIITQQTCVKIFGLC